MTPRKLSSMSLSQLRARGGLGPGFFISTIQREHARVNNRAQMRCRGLAPDAKRVVRAGGEQQLAVAVEYDRLRPAPRAPHPARAHQDTTRTRKGPLVLLPSLAWASRLLKPHGRPSKAWVPRLPKDLPKGPSALSEGPSALDLPKRSFGVARDRSFSPARDLPKKRLHARASHRFRGSAQRRPSETGAMAQKGRRALWSLPQATARIDAEQENRLLSRRPPRHGSVPPTRTGVRAGP